MGDVVDFPPLDQKSNETIMKTISCQAMGGPCDMAISAATAEEMMEKGTAHVQGADDDAHKALLEEMSGMSEEEKAGWAQKVTEQFDNAPEDE